LSESREVTVRELIHRLHDATGKMSKKNGHRVLMLQAMSALMQLVRQIEAQAEPEAEKPRVELAYPMVTLQ
jgi:hypothetical protein